MRFDQKVGTTKWPKQVNFSGPHLHFLFHSDSSNTEWGYKFKVSIQQQQRGRNSKQVFDNAKLDSE